ncbi:hypothetical protein [Streptomyces sp. NBC_01187]|uniref:hypothetical protein n=1 Tax=Streptomyces sp. NBC_01187 TaxID=2903766 RepID=UPI003863D03C|nr:hypothetical protein OG220_10865 [Streptomyces sp. NBC_01187]
MTGNALDFRERTEAGRTAVDTRLARMKDALRVHGLAPVRESVYRDESGDGTGDMGWLWLRAEPRAFPGESHDLVVRYSEADGDWQISTPDDRARTLPAADDAASAEAVAAAAVDVLALASGRASVDEPVVRNLPDWVALLLSGVATSLIIPFVQAVAGRSAEDAYAGLRTRLARSEEADPDPAPDPASPDPASPGPAPSGYVSIVDPDADLQLVVPDPMPPDAVRQLVAMDRSELRGRTLVWDVGRQEWFRCRRA